MPDEPEGLVEPSVIQTIISWAENHPSISEIWLFGSRATGTHRPDSDLDLALLLKQGGAVLGLYLSREKHWTNELSRMLGLKVHLRPTQEGDASYTKLLSGDYKGARRLWARVGD
jgi:predicted nucleotidyltransferase